MLKPNGIRGRLRSGKVSGAEPSHKKIHVPSSTSKTSAVECCASTASKIDFIIFLFNDFIKESKKGGISYRTTGTRILIEAGRGLNKVDRGSLKKYCNY